jgi:hypothetical protein
MDMKLSVPDKLPANADLVVQTMHNGFDTELSFDRAGVERSRHLRSSGE